MADLSELTAESLTVQAGSILLDEVSLTANAGEVLGLTGPSGSGKTSLLHVLAGLAAPVSGRLLLDGAPVPPWREISVQIILQNLHLLATLTAHETVALPMQAQGLARAEVTERADRTLGVLGLGDHGRHLIEELSGGQRQRVAVARALAGAPDLLLADEPTAALDPHWHSMVVDQLWTAARNGAIVIVASSDPELIGRCHHVLALE